MTGRRTRRWLDRLRAAVGRGPSSSERTGLDGFTARSHPPTVSNSPPNATASAPTAHDRDLIAPPGPGAPAAGEAPEAAAPPVAGEPDVTAEPGAAPGPGETTSAGPRVHVHRGRLERRVAPMELSPTEALRLAEEGRAGLSRRELPPDVAGDAPGGGGDTDAD